MRLFHGTNGAWLDHILREGIKPRGRSNGRSNWNHTVRSNPRCVYLTDSYAPYFAHNASRGATPSCAVIEIDTDRLDDNDLFPDEDFLEQASRGMPGAVPGTMKERTMHYRREQFTYNLRERGPCCHPTEIFTTWWEASLFFLGTCSHRGTIPASAITRAVTWPRRPNVWMSFVWDPSISIMNQKVMGDRYRALTTKLMAGEFTAADPNVPEVAAHDDLQAYFLDPKLPPIEGWQRIDVAP